MSTVLVLVDHVEGSVRKTTAELLTIARRLGEPAAVLAARGADAALAALGEYGAATVYVADAEGVDDYLVVPKVEALQAAIAAAGGPSRSPPCSCRRTSEGKEIAARLAVRLDSGIITDAVDVQPGDGGPVTTQAAFAGGYAVKAHVTKGVAGDHRQAELGRPRAGARARRRCTRLDLTLSDAAKSVRIVERKPKAKSGRPDLSEAAIVVSGGRGTNGDFGPVEQFADALGAAVGASRAAVDAGWYPHSNQVGPDRQAGVAAALRRRGHLRRDPAPRRHADDARRSSPSTRTPRPRSSSSPTSASSATSSRCCRRPPTRSPSARADPGRYADHAIAVIMRLPSSRFMIHADCMINGIA